MLIRHIGEEKRQAIFFTLKGPQQKCGGLEGTHGRCGTGLVCRPPNGIEFGPDLIGECQFEVSNQSVGNDRKRGNKRRNNKRRQNERREKVRSD